MDFSLIDKLTNAHIAAGDFPDAVVVIFNENGTLYRKAYGGADAGMWFDMASVSKTVTLSLIISLADGDFWIFTRPSCLCFRKDCPAQRHVRGYRA